MRRMAGGEDTSPNLAVLRASMSVWASNYDRVNRLVYATRS